MDYDAEKVDEAVLALLYLTTFDDGPSRRAWKGHDWDALARLHQRGFISDPKSKSKSVALTTKGEAVSRRLFYQLFGLPGSAERQTALSPPESLPPRAAEPDRDARIAREVLGDSESTSGHGAEWHAYLNRTIRLPFKAVCFRADPNSPLEEGQKVEAVMLREPDDGDEEMRIIVTWKTRIFAVPLAQLRPKATDPATQQALDDWRYWVERGNQL